MTIQIRCEACGLMRWCSRQTNGEYICNSCVVRFAKEEQEADHNPP